MTQSNSQATKFYTDVAKNKKLWTIKDKGGFPAPISANGERSIPFWSDVTLVEKIINNLPLYSGFQPYELSWKEFESKWIPGLTEDALLVGLNWGGKQATGYDVTPQELLEKIKRLMGE